jgi:hypothetical protein
VWQKYGDTAFEINRDTAWDNIMGILRVTTVQGYCMGKLLWGYFVWQKYGDTAFEINGDTACENYYGDTACGKSTGILSLKLMGILHGTTVWGYCVRQQYGDTACDNSTGILRGKIGMGILRETTVWGYCVGKLIWGYCVGQQYGDTA